MKKIVYSMLMIAALISCKKDEVEDDTNPNPTPSGPTIPEEFAAFVGIFDGDGVGAALNLTEDILVLFNQEGDTYAWFEDQEIKYVNDINADDSPFVSCLFDRVGAASKTSDERFYFYDEDGARYTNTVFDPEAVSGSWNDPELFDFWQSWSTTNLWGPDNTISINSVSAMWPISDPGNDCFDATETYDLMWMVDGNGDEMIVWDLANFSWPGVEIETEDYVAENNCGGMDELMPFESISAACRYVKPNIIQDIFFSEDGTQFCYYTVSEGVFSEIFDLY